MPSKGTHAKGGYYIMRGWVDQARLAGNKKTWRWNHQWWCWWLLKVILVGILLKGEGGNVHGF
jgi:hypothetical protein